MKVKVTCACCEALVTFKIKNLGTVLLFGTKKISWFNVPTRESSMAVILREPVMLDENMLVT